MEVDLGSFSFSSNFECGNLAKVHPIQLAGHAGSSASSHRTPKGAARNSDSQADYEFNLWTKPDCGGTEFENNNRTWFCFCIKGGVAGERVQLSVMNLNKQSKLYSQGMQPVVRCIGDCVQSSNWERIKEKCSYRSEENSTVVSWVHTVPPENRATFYAFTYPYTYSQLQNFLQNMDNRFRSTSSLYYYRELLTKSLDGNRVDLITITSNKGKQEECEDRLPDLFPNWSCPRPNRFEKKKVVFVSARVHPGETSSSFVLCGFINFILSSDARAARLRDLFIFKIIPMLNPDGVIRGHYRSDQRGVNLNRVYSNPSPEFHPTIYAAKKVILYYHYGMRSDAVINIEDASSRDTLTETTLQKSLPPPLDEDTCHSFSDAVNNKAKPSSGIPNPATKAPTMIDSEEPSISGWDCSSNMSGDSSCRAGSFQTNWEDFQDEASNRFCANTETGVTSMFGSMSPLRELRLLSKEPAKTPSNASDCLNFTGDFSALSEPEPIKSFGSDPSSYIFHSDQRKNVNIPSSVDPSPAPDEEKLERLRSASFPFPSSSILNDSNSKLFMYMDFHGHASKRGIFMYGNWFEDPVLMVESMLYPKILSLNCSNFDFGACNFSERNMSHRDRRDGMSKEGSGRVSVMRATGLVRSYTLECNYNTGRQLNPIPSHGPHPKPSHLHGIPPKYTPAIFEDCGHKLGICLHDLVRCDAASESNTPNALNLNLLRSELFNSLSSTSSSSSHRTPVISSSGTQAVTSNPKHAITSSSKQASLRNLKDFKSISEEAKIKERATTSRVRAGNPLATKASLSIAPFSQKLKCVHSCSGARRKSLSSTVDAENQAPLEPRARVMKTKSNKAKKETCSLDASQSKTKKFRYKSTSAKKVGSSQSLLFKDLGEASHFSPTEKLDSSKHSLGGAVCLPGDVGLTKSDSSKLIKKIEKGRKQRSKTLKFGSKKLKNLSSCEASSTSFKSDQFCKVGDDKIGSSLAMEPRCVTSPNPLSPRSPLASVFEAQGGPGTQGTSRKQKSPFVSSSKGSFHACAKRQPKTMKPSPSCSERFPIVPPPTGQRIKLYPKKLKKRANIADVSGKILPKSTASQAPLQWVLRKPIKMGPELEPTNPLNPRVKKRKKSARKPL